MALASSPTSTTLQHQRASQGSFDLSRCLILVLFGNPSTNRTGTSGIMVQFGDLSIRANRRFPTYSRLVSRLNPHHPVYITRTPAHAECQVFADLSSKPHPTLCNSSHLSLPPSGIVCSTLVTSGNFISYRLRLLLFRRPPFFLGCVGL